MAGTQITVADDEDVFTALNRVHGFGTQRCNFRFHAFVSPTQRVGDVQSVATEFALGVLFNIAQFRHIGEIQHGLGHFEAHGRVDLVDVQQIRFRADEGNQAHHNRFANRVDRRIGHLREQLFEVVIERFVFIRQHGERAIVTHRTNRFFAVGCHGCEQEFHVFLRETEGLLAVEQRDLAFGRSRGFAAALHVVQTNAQVFNPLLVGFAVGESGFEFFIVNHAALLKVDQEHFAGLQTPFAHDFVFGHGQYAGFRTHDDQIVIGDAVARRAQAVAVERRTDLATIGKHDGSGAVPRFQHRGMVFVERAATLVHHGVVFPRLGNHHHHGLANRVAGHGEQFQAVIERCGVGLTGKADGIQFLQIVAQHGGRHHAFTRFHPVVIAFNGVDFTVMRHAAVRMRQRPFGERVGRETLMHQAQRRNAALVGQIVVIRAHLVGQ